MTPSDGFFTVVEMMNSTSIESMQESTTKWNSSIIPLIFVSSDFFLEFCSNSVPVKALESRLHSILLRYGVPSGSLPTAEEIVLSMCATVITLLAYFFLFGKRHVKRRQKLAAELELAQSKVHYLEEKLVLAVSEDMQAGTGRKNDKEVRIFMDGAFDMMHYGHMNAFRLARSLGTHLIVGVNSDESIKECKGEPLMNDQERLTMVSGCKFVDQVIPGCPYVMNSEYLDYVIKNFKVDYVIHGDDPCIVDGKDVYAAAKAKGKYRSIPRTEGVSTTDFIGRMLLLTKEHHQKDRSKREDSDRDETMLLGRQSKFLTTSRMMRLFSAGVKAPSNDMKVIYIDGAWDMFHCGHVTMLKEAKKRGDYVIVGVHGDAIVNRSRGANLPLMNLHERVLSLLGCRYVDDVLIDAPYVITSDMISSLNISEVVRGSKSEMRGQDVRYAVPKEIGIFKIIESPSGFTINNIVSRIHKNHETFQAKFERKMKQENEYYEERYSKQKI